MVKRIHGDRPEGQVVGVPCRVGGSHGNLMKRNGEGLGTGVGNRGQGRETKGGRQRGFWRTETELHQSRKSRRGKYE